MLSVVVGKAVVVFLSDLNFSLNSVPLVGVLVFS